MAVDRAIIKVESLSKQYRIGGVNNTYSNLRDALATVAKAPFQRFRRNRNHESNTIWALKDVSFEVWRGEVHASQNPFSHYRPDLRPARALRPHREPARSRDRFSPRINRTRKHLPERRDPRNAEVGDQAEV